MITKETAYKVWNCYHEIEKSEKLLADMQEQLAKTGDMNLIDAFGRKQNLQLGIPCGNASQSIFDIRPNLAIRIIEQHISDQQELLDNLYLTVKSEL